MHKLSFFFSAVFIIGSLNVVFAGGEGPLTPKASLIRYWKKKISNDLPQPSFLLEKASPLTAVQLAAFSKLTAQLSTFCAAAHLFCYPDLGPSLENHAGDVNFKGYGERNFTNYGTGRVGKRDSFDAYAPDGNSGLNSFRRYSRDSVGHDDKFSNYAPNTNVPDQSFNTYGTKTTGGHGDFKMYTEDVNVAGVRFTSYSDDTGGREQKFTAYSNNGNGGDQSFTSYGKSGSDAVNAFTSYGNSTNGATSSFGNYGENGKIGNDSFTSYGKEGNVPGNNFKNYGAGGNGATDSFTSYGDYTNAGGQSFTGYGKTGNGAKTDFRSYGYNTNVGGSSFGNYGENGNGSEDSFTSYGEKGTLPEQNFKSYATGGNRAVETFKNYRDRSNEGDDSFTGYAKSSNAATVKFTNYGKSFHEGSDTFSGYGGGGNVKNQQFGFKIYGVNNTFKDYSDKKRVSFASYTKGGSGSSAELQEMKARGKFVNKWVEPGKFFRESNLKSGTIMPMPDIRDKMPKRSFLPRVISSKLPFSTSKLGELKKIFHAGDNSSMEGMMANALTECERAPSRGESKRCVGSIEDMIDFATSILGRNIVVRTTENTIGSKANVTIGEVKGINGGKVTKSVSCHQSLFPYLLYYCHSVPKVRVYEADLLDPKTNSKINHAIAICHIDTSSWSATHGAFLALGSGPGKIEVCHWIFENDMTWVVAD